MTFVVSNKQQLAVRNLNAGCGLYILYLSPSARHVSHLSDAPSESCILKPPLVRHTRHFAMRFASSFSSFLASSSIISDNRSEAKLRCGRWLRPPRSGKAGHWARKRSTGTSAAAAHSGRNLPVTARKRVSLPKGQLCCHPFASVIARSHSRPEPIVQLGNWGHQSGQESARQERSVWIDLL